MLGLITGSYEKLASTRIWCDRYGSHVAPDVCWLALRGLRTLGVRMQRHYANALVVRNGCKRSRRSRRSTFGLCRTTLATRCGKTVFRRRGPFTFELQRCSESAFEHFIDALKLFGLGSSWGGVDSLLMPAIPHHLRALKTQPDEGRPVRVHISLADPDDLCNDLQQAFAHMDISKRPG